MKTKPAILWMLADSPIVGLVKYDRQAERITKYPLGARAVGVLASTMNGGSVNSNLMADGQNGLWVPSSRVYITLTGEQNVSRIGFSTMKATRTASTVTPLLSVYRIGVACCGWELRMRGSIFSISGKNSSSSYRHIAPPTPIASHPAGSRRSIRIPMAFCG